MDTRFSAAIHGLILIAGADKPLTSEQIAAGVGTNPSYIRRLTGLLKQAERAAERVRAAGDGSAGTARPCDAEGSRL